jgi:hypothetical protein
MAAVIVTGLAGCGGKATAVKTDAVPHARSARSVPAYRVGQYCHQTSEHKYNAAGFTCKHHHLTRN